MSRFVSLFCIFFWSITTAFTANSTASLLLESDKTTASLSEPVIVTITLKAKETNSVDMNALQISGLDSFEVRGTSSSMQTMIINGTAASEIQETLTLYPKKTGKFTLGPVSYTLAGTKISSDSLQIRVTENTVAPISLMLDKTSSQDTDILSIIIMITGGVLALSIIIGIVFYRYTQLSKNSKKLKTIKEVNTTPNILTIENALPLIKDFLQSKYHIPTDSLTTQELLQIEQNSEKKLILQKCLKAIQLHEYGNTQIDNKEFIPLLQQYLYDNTRANS